MQDRFDSQSPADFDTTQWSVVLQAQGGSTPQAEHALAQLCKSYWRPLFAFIRRQHHPAELAADLTQEFFLRFLEKDYLRTVDRDRGRFRSYLLACCKHFLANQRDRARAVIHGGGRTFLPLDFATAGEWSFAEPQDDLTPEKLYQRRWTLTLLDNVFEQLRFEYSGRGKGELFDALRDTLAGMQHTPALAAIGQQQGMSEAAIKKALQRMRDRYRALLRAAIAATVESSDQVDDEIRELFQALGP